MMWQVLVLVLSLAAANSELLTPSCEKLVYCDSKILHHVQINRLYNDSKTFVDLQMINEPNVTLKAFDALLNKTNNNPTKDDIKTFVDEYFNSESELDTWNPPDYNENPPVLAMIRDENLRKFAKDVNAIWPSLGRKVKAEVSERPDHFSFIPVSHGFIIPGGRFKELYYWDTYWIIEGLLISGMDETAKGMIENLIELLKTIGHVPNGSRWYYQGRSQPPLLAAMMSIYVRHTGDMEFLKNNIEALESELQYWLDTQRFTFSIDDRAYTLLRYYAPSEGPRPESYYEDYTNAQETFDSDTRRQEFYNDIKSAAESGFDFSSRWFIDQSGSNTGNLTNIHTEYIIPVDLNAIFANALLNAAYFRGLLGYRFEASHWASLAHQWRADIESALWNEEDGVWYDYDLKDEAPRKYFYPSNVAPLWMGAVDKDLVKKHAPKVIKYLRQSHGLDFPGGIPTSLIQSGEQWDFPNAWPPLVSVVVNALEALDTDEGYKLAFEVAEAWVRACYKGYNETKNMYEKYDARVPGQYGAGGEYAVQAGFGWSNGVVLEFLAKYGQSLTASEDASAKRLRHASSIPRVMSALRLAESAISSDGDLEILINPEIINV